MRVRGRVRIHPGFLTERAFALDAEGRHFWRPIAPIARVETEFESPALRWSGDGYLDTNFGDGPLEDAFASWTWSRARLERGAAVTYDVVRRNSDPLSLALRFDADGATELFTPPPERGLPKTLWRIPRRARSEASVPAVLETLEDTPFYARSVVKAQLLGERTTAIHESLSLDRFRSLWVQALLPFRMPRRTR